MGELLYSGLTEVIIGSAFQVHNMLGKNHSEFAYRNALVAKLRTNHLHVEVEKDVPLYFEKTLVGKQRLDILVENKIILEIKAVKRISSDYLSKLLATLRNSRFQLGLVINFGPSVQIRRVINSGQNQ